MACSSCSSGADGAPKGCNNNGACSSGSCNKLSVFDWLANMSLPAGEAPFDLVEIRFKNGRKEFYRNADQLTLQMGDVVATEGAPGHDIGIVSLCGELVRVQMKKKGVELNASFPKIYRKASQKDIDIWNEARLREEPTKVKARELAIGLKLEMKISDVEFQGDGSKATFYYTANDRVDFRQLIKEFAREFGVRIEMKQVGFRQEASRLGGIGSCGRELCCSTWLTDFRSVNTSAARYQQLSLNPQKLAGQCGKLKCCLNYELDTYMDALKGFPDFDTRLQTEKGDAVCQKQDIFKGLMWFAYTDSMAQWHTLHIEDVHEIIAENKAGRKVSALEDYAEEPEAVDAKKVFTNAMGQESITRFDQPRKRKSKSRKKRPAEGAPQGNPQSTNRPPREGDNRPRREGNTDRRREGRPNVAGSQTDGGSKPQQNGPKPQSEGQGNRNKRFNKNRRNGNTNTGGSSEGQ